MKKTIIYLAIVIGIIITLICASVFLEFDNGKKLTYIRFNEDISDFENYTCYDEAVSYNQEKDISITNYNFEKFLFFYIIELEYEKGNLCDSEYVLEESYIQNFLENAEIKYNEQNIDIAKLIEGKTAIVGNTRYLGNDYTKSISYVLDEAYEELFVFYVDDLLVIQVGLTDEEPKYIAYK